MKTCIACGMPMKDASEHAMNDPKKDYCIYCARPDGSMQSFDEKLESMADFIVRTQGFDRKAALRAAEDMMKKLPAWEGCF
ncbi:MAG: zinc ribbon domain-containing protein [Candidatus Methanoplasma sp.]|nr:zinc ribbon domain-containing protein [Candidatus Methanoplasma sp.]